MRKFISNNFYKINNIQEMLINHNNKLNNIDNYNKQYHNLTIKYNNTFHDRYFILDRNIIYHCGASLNHMGNKTFSINILEDAYVKQSIIDKISQII